MKDKPTFNVFKYFIYFSRVVLLSSSYPCMYFLLGIRRDVALGHL